MPEYYALLQDENEAPMDCGCRMEREDGDDVAYYQCRTHAAAPEMYKVLRGLWNVLRTNEDLSNDMPIANINALQDILTEIDHPPAKAKAAITVNYELLRQQYDGFMEVLGMCESNDITTEEVDGHLSGIEMLIAEIIHQRPFPEGSA